MALDVDGTTLTWDTATLIFNGVTFSTPTNPGTVVFNGTTVFGLSGSFTTIFNSSLAPDSVQLENVVVPAFQSTYAAAFASQGYIQGPGQDSTYRVVLNPGYRVTATAGQGGQWVAGQTVDFFEGKTVTGINTSHNGGTSFILEKDDGV